MGKGLRWSALKENRCPQCGEDIDVDNFDDDMMYFCQCGFKISQHRYEEIVSDIVNKDLDSSF